MDVIVQLAPALVDAILADDSRSAEPSARSAAVRDLGVSLEPLSPGITDPLLRTYFRIPVADAAEGERVVAGLLGREGVDAAYLQPEAGLPG